MTCGSDNSPAWPGLRMTLLRALEAAVAYRVELSMQGDAADQAIALLRNTINEDCAAGDPREIRAVGDLCEQLLGDPGSARASEASLHARYIRQAANVQLRKMTASAKEQADE